MFDKADRGSTGRHPVYFVRRVPIDSIRGGKPVPSLMDPDIWYPPLVKNIREKGLVNPLFILNHRPRDSFNHQWILTGMNRLKALRELGWTEVPCIITGPIDKWDLPPLDPELALQWRRKDGFKVPPSSQIALDGKLLRTPLAVNEYFTGGKVKFYSNGDFGYGNNMIPEKQKYPKTGEPYWP